MIRVCVNDVIYCFIDFPFSLQYKGFNVIKNQMNSHELFAYIFLSQDMHQNVDNKYLFAFTLAI